MDNRALLITVTALAIAGVLGLFVYSSTLEPLSLGIGEIGEKHVGTIIRTQGTITSARSVSVDYISLTVCDFTTSSSIPVFYSPGSGGTGQPLVPGMEISIQGEVRLYQESVEIMVSEAGGITVLASASGTEYRLDILMQSIRMFDGLNVTSSGKIVDLEVIYSSDALVGTAFQVVEQYDNQSYSLTCFCYGRDLAQLYNEWDPIRVTGTISYYANGGCWQMSVEVAAPG
jgi:DNA/RNA endonuclease YhcR with UshA esterase domain